jgi:hypothetical protein
VVEVLMASKNKTLAQTQRILQFVTPVTGSGANTTSYIDLAQVLSMVNRRMYRQGMDYHISKIEVLGGNANATNSSVTVSVVSNNWVTCNAWKKGRMIWDKIQKNAVKAAGAQSAVAKYRDFKVLMDSTHDPAANNLFPADVSGTSGATGEWQYSTVDITDPSGVNAEYKLKLLGGNTSTVLGLIRGYADSRAYPSTSEPLDSEPNDGWYMEVNDPNDHNEHSVDAATDENDTPPYAVTLYHGDGGGSFDAPMSVGTRSLATINNGVHGVIGSFVACAGLLRIDHFCGAADTTHNVGLLIHLKPGSYKGVSAMDMGA